LRNLLSGLGLREAMTLTLSPPSDFEDDAHGGKRVLVRSALSAELSGLRRSLIPNLLGVLAHNVRQRQLDVRLFEVGKVFSLGAKPGEYHEARRVGAVLTGHATPRGWEGEAGRADFYSAKGVVEALGAALKLSDLHFQASTRPGMHPGRSADVLIGAAVVGFIAEIDPDTAREQLDVPAGLGRIAVFELDADILMTHASDGDRYHAAPRFPAISRDISALLDRAVPFADVEAVVRETTDPAVLEDLAVVSIYTGERVGADKKAVAFRMTFRAPDRTLTDIEVDTQVADVDAALAARLGAGRR
jgi:phenylalanyl-tRNA synthetase beta chain